MRSWTGAGGDLHGGFYTRASPSAAQQGIMLPGHSARRVAPVAGRHWIRSTRDFEKSQVECCWARPIVSVTPPSGSCVHGKIAKNCTRWISTQTKRCRQRINKIRQHQHVYSHQCGSGERFDLKPAYYKFLCVRLLQFVCRKIGCAVFEGQREQLVQQAGLVKINPDIRVGDEDERCLQLWPLFDFCQWQDLFERDLQQFGGFGWTDHTLGECAICEAVESFRMLGR
jgi:hypothetical protein